MQNKKVADYFATMQHNIFHFKAWNEILASNHTMLHMSEVTINPR